jgi:hypothetical protein
MKQNESLQVNNLQEWVILYRTGCSKVVATREESISWVWNFTADTST